MKPWKPADRPLAQASLPSRPFGRLKTIWPAWSAQPFRQNQPCLQKTLHRKQESLGQSAVRKPQSPSKARSVDRSVGFFGNFLAAARRERRKRRFGWYFGQRLGCRLHLCLQPARLDSDALDALGHCAVEGFCHRDGIALGSGDGVVGC